MKSTTMIRYRLLPALLLSLLAGCKGLPELQASHHWNGRDAKEIIQFLGPPTDMQPSADRSLVTMRWYRNTSYVSKEVVGSTSEMQGNVMVNTNYWDDVNHPGSCTLSAIVDKARLIRDFSASGRCYGVAMEP